MQSNEVVVGRRRGKKWRRVGYGLYRDTAEVATPPVASGADSQAPARVVARREHLADLGAWQEVLPAEGCFTHLTGADVLGLWMPPVPEGMPVHACIPRDLERSRRRGLQVSRVSARIGSTLVGGVRVAPPAEVLLACARDLGLLDLVVLLDSALHAELVTATEVDALAAGRRRGTPALRRALRLADGRAESPWESLLRMFHVLSGIPVEPQHDVRDERGAFVARGDLWLEGTRTLHEYDGAVHRDARAHRQDLMRERRLANLRWVRRGYTAQDLLHRGHVILREASADLDRPYDPRRMDPWSAALRESLFTSDGRSRLARRWARGPG
jgi:hypothetical protein